jgi:lincosamide nucleotidyltransferase A/C/D/E
MHGTLGTVMDAADVVELLDLLEQHGLDVYVDGGWAVDALLGKQTRSHNDLDIAIPHEQVPIVRNLMAARGFHERPQPDSWECNFVLADAGDRRLDVHSYTLDATGRNVGGVPYVAEHLTGTGVIAERSVRCIDPAWLVKFHTGYDVDERDHHDVRLLCERFGLPLPEEYTRFSR